MIVHLDKEQKYLARILAFFLVYDGVQLLPFVLLKEYKYIGEYCLGLHRKYESVPEEDMVIGLGLFDIVLLFMPCHYSACFP